MKHITDICARRKRAVRVLQFGEGNFLRAFADWMIDIANERGVFDGGVMIAKAIPQGGLDNLRAQDCLYTVWLRGKQNGQTVNESRLVQSVSGAVDCYTGYDEYAALAGNPALRFIISNTTEAGIALDGNEALAQTPPTSFPGKLTKFLYERWQAFGGAPGKGCIILPVELIDSNGQTLRACCLTLAKRWGLPAAFTEWLTEHNTFCQTLVDRIVSGYPKEDAADLEARLGYSDKLLTVGEPFALWVIECENPDAVRAEFPLDKAGLPVVFTRDIKPYRERKVRILNGAHTATALAAYLAGLDTVGEMCADSLFSHLLKRALYGELLPCVPLPETEVRAFADSVAERFGNPFIRHSLLSISLNSVSKFKARVLPTLTETLTAGRAADALCCALAALMAFYGGQIRDGRLYGVRTFTRNGAAVSEEYEIQDDAAVLSFFAECAALPAKELTARLLARRDFWGANLNELPGLAERAAAHLDTIRQSGARAAISRLLAV